MSSESTCRRPCVPSAERRARGQRLTNVTFIHGDAQVHAFTPGGFDIAISRTGKVFFRDPVATFANIGQALRPSGRLVQLTWQSALDNEWIAPFQQVLAAGRQLPPDEHRSSRTSQRHDPNSLPRPPVRAYTERRRADCKNPREIRRCIKRYLARHLYRLMETNAPQPAA
jgi:SAM-dependent methyltransferase